MNIELERQAFEGWADQQWPGAKRQQLERDEYGQYKNTIYRDYWTGWQARATRPAQTEQQPAYVECRECTDCGHVGINDAHPTDATCAMCDWSGPSPVEDQCPDCGKENAMGAACPKCSGRYRILAETHVAAPIAQTAPQPEQSGLVEALGAFVSLAEDRLHELGALSPEMAECLANGRAALSAQGESHE